MGRNITTGTGVYACVKRALLLAFTLVFALTAAPAMAQQEEHPPDCCVTTGVRLTSRQVKSLLLKTEPVQPPLLGTQVRIDSTVTLEIGVDTDGNVTCLRVISGHPLIVQSVMESVKRWTFRPYILRKLPKTFCGHVALRVRVNDRVVKYDVVEAPSN